MLRRSLTLIPYVMRQNFNSKPIVRYQSKKSCQSQKKKGRGTKRILTRLANHSCGSGHKVSIIGAGEVGIACAVLMLRHVTTEVTLIDLNEKRVKGQVMDLQHGARFLNDANITGGPDYELSQNSNIIVITAGARPKGSESRLSLVQRNADIMKSMVPNLVQHSPDAILVVVSNPVDVLTYVTWRISGFDKNRVIGSGTVVDTSRLQTFIAQRFKVAPSSCNAYVIGEHGENAVITWSLINIAGTRLCDLNPDIGKESDPEKWDEIESSVIKAGYNVRMLKGHTNWAIGLSVVAICEAILKNSNRVFPVTVSAKGKFGIGVDVFLSLPAVINSNGATDIVNLRLSPEEIKKLRKSAQILKKIQDEVKLEWK